MQHSGGGLFTMTENLGYFPDHRPISFLQLDLPLPMIGIDHLRLKALTLTILQQQRDLFSSHPTFLDLDLSCPDKFPRKIRRKTYMLLRR
ncbi:hypothetical protein GCM10025790_10850 [Nesterenkonia rhizosphaerae]|uniref:Uncharacterized protein n=1 Tax=Nesterenkonia rhizosphaerae TaxID=1348272 RepID=A0ABP9FUV7_9MICC